MNNRTMQSVITLEGGERVEVISTYVEKSGGTTKVGLAPLQGTAEDTMWEITRDPSTDARTMANHHSKVVSALAVMAHNARVGEIKGLLAHVFTKDCGNLNDVFSI